MCIKKEKHRSEHTTRREEGRRKVIPGRRQEGYTPTVCRTLYLCWERARMWGLFLWWLLCTRTHPPHNIRVCFSVVTCGWQWGLMVGISRWHGTMSDIKFCLLAWLRSSQFIRSLFLRLHLWPCVNKVNFIINIKIRQFYTLCPLSLYQKIGRMLCSTNCIEILLPPPLEVKWGRRNCVVSVRYI